MEKEFRGGEVEEKSYALLLIAAAFTFLILPFYVTFNEFLTEIVKTIGLYQVIDAWIAPTVARMVASMLALFGVESGFQGSIVYLASGEHSLYMYIAWNCVGWQGIIVFLTIAYMTLKDLKSSKVDKIITLLIGLQGTILINVLRIVLVGIISIYLGMMRGILFHDYAGSLITFTWLLGFWYVMTRKEAEQGSD